MAADSKEIWQLSNPREELMEEAMKQKVNAKPKSYVVNILVGGIFTKALVVTGSEITCISESHFSTHQDKWKPYPLLTLTAITVEVAIPGKVTKINKEVLLEVRFENT